jgi:hypothetical protein
MVTWIEQPVTVQSQAQMLAFKLKDPELGNKAVEKLVAKYPDRFVKKPYGGKHYDQVQIPMPPNAPPDQPMPTPCFGVVDDYLMAANRTSLLEKAIATLADGSKSLADELDFKLVASKIERLSRGSKPAMISFNRPEESMRFLYDLVSAESTRQGLRRNAENSRFFKSIDTALTQNPLPPFAVLQRYLAPAGAMVVDDATGIHYTAFTLRRKTE